MTSELSGPMIFAKAGRGVRRLSDWAKPSSVLSCFVRTDGRTYESILISATHGCKQAWKNGLRRSKACLNYSACLIIKNKTIKHLIPRCFTLFESCQKIAKCGIAISFYMSYFSRAPFQLWPTSKMLEALNYEVDTIAVYLQQHHPINFIVTFYPSSFYFPSV